QVDRIKKSFTLPATEAVDELVKFNPNDLKGKSTHGYVISPRSNASFKAVNELLNNGAEVSRVMEGDKDIEAGSFIVKNIKEDKISDLGLSFTGLSKAPRVKTQSVSSPKVATYMSWMANMDEGWTRFMLEEYGVEVDTLHNSEMIDNDLSEYNTIILPSQSAKGIMDGYSIQQMPEEYTGGLGLEGTLALKKFVEERGTLIAFDAASEYAINQFGFPLRNA